MTDLLTTLAEKYSHKIALVDDRPDGTLIEWSFAELEANANRLARVYQAMGVNPGDRVLWCGQNACWVVAAGHAARKAGAVSVPLNYRLTEDEAAYVVDNCDAQVAFVDAEFADLLRRIAPRTPRLRTVLVYDGEPLEGQLSAAPLLAAADPAPLGIDHPPLGTMIYTSGTTGKPKGAIRQPGGNPYQAAQMIAVYGVRPGDVYITTGPLYHSGPSSFLSHAQSQGNLAVLQRQFDAVDWLRLVDRWKVSFTFSAPTPIRRITQLPDEHFRRYSTASMRIMVANAAPWTYALKLAYLARFPEDSLFEVYGSTELGVNTILRPEFQRSKPGSCGQPAPGVQIRLYAEDGGIVTTPREPGELFVQSASVFATYHKAHDKFLADQREGWQTVGDIAYFDEEGFYYICDRKKDMIISGGVNIYPAEIEAALDLHPDVLEAAVFGIPNEEWGESVHAVVVRRPGSALDEAGVQAWARERLAGYKVPRSISFAAELPKTGSGKVLKRELRDPYWPRRDWPAASAVDHGTRRVP